ncbi:MULTISPECIES: YrrS family protein [Clostridia]|uniref:YrrS family protein n=1 Tax=Clostridia TaxID=186801 RepID=UPI000EA303AB|nr:MULTISPECIES: YrrS family protein [Clostridia]NBJ68610.1 DUF1510 family protein [Roseburia sp. 1XD42-34]RKI80707.1 DUF1510 family protein [Clostridium sp. 1xD42-85]
MSDFDRVSRVDKFEKRRKNTKSISILLVVGAVLLIILLGVWLFGDDEDAAKDDSQEPNAQTEADEKSSEAEDGENEDQFTRIEENDDKDKAAENELEADEKQSSDEEQSGSEGNAAVETEQVEPSNDNVVKAYTADWKPIGTEQEGPHTTNYDEGSQDRKEIATAAAEVTGLDESSMVTHWVGNGGDQQKVEATISNKDNSQIYRVYLTWVDEQGWKPTKVEQLKQVIIN